MPAGNVRLDCAMVSLLYAAGFAAQLCHHAAQLMPDHSRVGVNRMCARKSVVVASAETYIADADHGEASLRLWFGSISMGEAARFIQNDLFQFFNSYLLRFFAERAHQKILVDGTVIADRRR